jgi:uncharacterized protein
MDWWLILAGGVMVLLSFAGVVLTAITLPGLWVPVLWALIMQWWKPSGQLPFDWWTIGIVVCVGVLAELIELASSAAGAARAGGSKRSALCAGVGSLIGALVGAPIALLLGAIVGAVIGAGLGAMLAERHWVGKSWGDSGRVAQGAAIGRLVALVVKISAAGAMGATLSVAAFVR